MNTAGLGGRIGRLEEAMEPTVEEALTWVEQLNPLVGRVLRKAVAIKAENDCFVRFPSGPMTIAEWERQCEEADAAKAKRDAEKAG